MTRVHGIKSLVLALAAVLVAGAAVVLLRPDAEPGPEPAPVRIERSNVPGNRHADEVSDQADPGAVTREALTSSSPEPEDISALAPAQIAGRVRDLDTGEAVAAFQVYVLAHTTESPLRRTGDAVPTPFKRGSGVFRLDQEPGLYDVVVTAPGYHPVAVRGIVVPPQQRKPYAFEMSRGAGITGIVLGYDGMPLKQVALFLDVKWIEEGFDAPAVTTTRTGPDGRFVFSPLAPGEYAISALEMNNTVDRLAAIRVRDELVEVSIPVAARHQLQVAVKDQGGRPVGDAAIEVRGEGRIFTAMTAESGLAVIDHLQDGDYTLSVSHLDFQDSRDVVTLYGGTGFTVRWITLEDRPPEGR